MFKLLLAVSAVSLLAGCATDPKLFRDRRDAAWDPPPGRSLFEQLPAWDGEARRRCGSHLPEKDRGSRSDRC